MREPLAKAYAPEDLQTTLPEDLKREPIDLPQLWIPPDWLARIVEIMFWLLIGVGALLALFYLGREVPAWLGRQRQLKAGATTMVQGSPLAADGQLLDALGRADRLAAEGQFAEALHLLLLHSIDYLKRHLGARLRSVEHGAGDSAAVALAGRRPELPGRHRRRHGAQLFRRPAGRWRRLCRLPPALSGLRLRRDAVMNDSIFSGRTLAWLLGIGIACFAGMMLLFTFGSELFPTSSIQPSTYSKSAIGHQAWVRLLQNIGQAGADQPQQLREEVPMAAC